MYKLSTKAVALADKATTTTLQAPAKGHGLGWRSLKHTGLNTRALTVVSVVETLPEQFTLDQFKAHLAAHKDSLLGLSATPSSRIKAWLANGYLELVEDNNAPMLPVGGEEVEAAIEAAKPKRGRK